jgi:uncharacterized protein DUF2336
MTPASLFPGFDGLMTLSRREGVDIRPTLLRVLTDLYVQANAHTTDEERQFVELTSRLIDQVDDATRAVVRARLAIYPGTPLEILRKLGLIPGSPDQFVAQPSGMAANPPVAAPVSAPSEAPLRLASNLRLQPNGADLNDMFFRAGQGERALILYDLADAPLQASARLPAARARRAIETLEMAAFAADVENFTLELGEALMLPSQVAARAVNDPGGEPLACAMKAIDMPSAVFQRVLLFLHPEFGSSVNTVYRLSRLYDRLDERSALVMLAAWRGSATAAARAKYRPALYDDERARARPASAQIRSSTQPAGSGIMPRRGSQG